MGGNLCKVTPGAYAVKEVGECFAPFCRKGAWDKVIAKAKAIGERFGLIFMTRLIVGKDKGMHDMVPLTERFDLIIGL
jgi:hypothetical protein